MINDSNMIPQETFFIDDGQANIQTAQELGLQTYLATNGEDFSHLFKGIL